MISDTCLKLSIQYCATLNTLRLNKKKVVYIVYYHVSALWFSVDKARERGFQEIHMELHTNFQLVSFPGADVLFVFDCDERS